ncbi:DNA translocase FtsK 4TM domain-containing protein [Gilliamella sp. B2911]|uniref:DNA translocase FtsK 4TM domain-containing protein n=1 Tax=Gilliamella sp. B2911 TaxID=2817980 RepID=UPI003A5CC048|nr:DNA translocase FtsK 4TM domain-containing protein [Gilliamella sp. B2911]
MKKSKITRRQIVAQLILLSLIGLSVYLFLSLFTYNPSDPGWSRTAWHYPISNLGGYIGAYISDILFQFFGLIAYSLPVIIIFFCLQLMGYFYRHASDPINYFSVSFRIIGILAFVLSCCGFFALNIRDPEQFQAGGYLGSIVIESLLPVMSSLATSLALLATTLACITLLTGFSWLYLFEKIGALVMFILSPIKWLFTPDKVSQPADSNQEDKLTTEKQPQFDLPIDVDTSDNIDSTKLATESDISTIKPISLKDDEVFIKTAAQLLQSIEANTSPNETNQPTKDISKKEMDPDAILARMETILKNMNESTTSDMSSTESDGEINSREALEPFEEDKYAIADAPSKPLFTMEHNEPKINLNHITSQDSVDPIVIEPLAETSPSITPEYHNTNDIPAEFEIPEDVDISLLKEENPLIDDIYQNEVVNESNEQQTNNEIKEVMDEDEEESLIHPLLKRNDKPLPKPTTPLPSLNLLTPPPTTRIEVDHAALNAMSEQIEKSLSDYRVKARVVDYLPGPVITRFEIELAPGIKAARISTLDRDLARSLSMPSVRVVEVIPGKPYVGIELPNKNRQTVYFREVLDSPQFKNAQSPLTIVLGKDIAGQSVVADLAKMPHLLVAGTTGSGKSVGVNAMILSILYKSQPEDVRFIMIDPKMLELSIYEGIPHLLTQVVTDMKDAANALNWCVNEMERRYRLMSALGVRNIAGFNEKIKLAEEMGRPIPDPLWKPTDSMDLEMPTLEKLPYIVVMVDEFADLIMAVGKKVEELIARLAQKARAAGIHLVLATQRPSVDVITGLIKANIPTRIAFTVSSKIDSRTILDQMGAESLLGMGDMLYLAPNSSIPIRVHGAFVRDEEVHAVVQDWKARGTPKYIENVTVSTDDNEGNSFDMTDEELDPLFDQVVAFVVETRRASISSVQRKFRIGYNRAARIVEQMEVEGIISAPSHNGNREVLAQASPNDY